MPDADVIVVGSGPAGVHAARTLLDGGASVLMLDGGRDGPPLHDAPTEPFADVRKKLADQWRWFLGEDLSAISLDGLTGGLGGGQMSGNKRHVADIPPGLLPLAVEDGIVVQSLARGGLGAAWGGACAVLGHDELTAMGLPPDGMERWYETAGRRIGVSGPPDFPWIQPPLPLDAHASSVAANAERKAATMRARRWKAVQPHSAVLSRDLGGRTASTLADMDYWADPGRSVYRPQHTLEELLRMPGFTYLPGRIVRRIARTDARTMTAFSDPLRQDDGASATHAARACVLACNAVGSARILLASLGLHGRDVPFLAKPRRFSVCLNPHLLGRRGSDRRISFCQYLLLDETPRDGMTRACAQLYGYRSMLLFRLVGSMPLPMPHAIRLAALLSPALVIADIRFPVTLRDAAILRLEPGDAQAVSIRFPGLSSGTRRARDDAWRSIRSALRTVRLFPVRNMAMPDGSTAHYAGTVPHAEAGEHPLTSDAHGQSRELPGVWLADASTFRALPAYPHTLTVMANACRVAENVLRND